MSKVGSLFKKTKSVKSANVSMTDDVTSGTTKLSKKKKSTKKAVVEDDDDEWKSTIVEKKSVVVLGNSISVVEDQK